MSEEIYGFWREKLKSMSEKEKAMCANALLGTIIGIAKIVPKEDSKIIEKAVTKTLEDDYDW